MTKPPMVAPNQNNIDQAELKGVGEFLPLRISYVVARLERVLRQRIAQGVEAYQLTVAHYTALSILGRRSGLSNAQLARRTYISPQAMNQVLEQLQQAGLIQRDAHAHNGRILVTHLTEQGKKVLAACEAVVDQLEAEMLASLPLEERNHLRQALITCVRSLHGGLDQLE